MPSRWFSCPTLWPWIKPALNTMRSNHPAGHDLDLALSVKEKPCSQPPRASLHQLRSLLLPSICLPPFTLHFTADIISQISAHLVRIVTDSDGSGEESHPSCCKPPLLSNTFWVIRTALVLYSHVLINHCLCEAGLVPTQITTQGNWHSNDWCAANNKNQVGKFKNWVYLNLILKIKYCISSYFI